VLSAEVSSQGPCTQSQFGPAGVSSIRKDFILSPGDLPGKGLVGITSRPSASEKETADEAEEGAHTLGEVQQLEKFAICPQNSRPIPLLVVAISSLYSGVRAVGEAEQRERTL
jgi:hypothetical protein